MIGRCLLAVAAAVTLTACSAAASDPPAETRTPAVSPSAPRATGPAASATKPAPPSAAPRDVTLAFAGDVHFEEELRALLDDPQRALAEAAPLLRTHDVAMVNLESSITQRGQPEPKRYRFRTTPRALTALAAAGVDVVTMANNHAVDFGSAGLADTLAATRQSPVRIVGIGRNAAAAFAPALISVRGTRIAILAATDVPDLTAARWPAGDDRPGVASARNPARLLAAVRRTRATADVVVVYLHWGEERVSCSTREQRSLARDLADAGADVVVGSHAHVLLGDGWLGRTYVSYGLGNFVWYSPNSVAEATSGVLRLTLRAGRVVRDEWLPAALESGRTRPLAGAAAAQAVRRQDALRGCTNLTLRPGH